MTEKTAIRNAKSKLLSDLQGWIERLLPDGRRQGSEWVACNPCRADKTPGSFKVSLKTGKWSDFAIQKSGDILDLYCYVRNLTRSEALRELDALPDLPARERKPGIAMDDWIAILPAPREARTDEISHPKRGKPARVHTYRDTESRVLGYVCRFDASDGSKDLLPFTFCRTGQRTSWRWKGFPRPRPLYGLDRLAAKPDAPVLIVEGEKCADAAHEALPGFAVLSWPGGCQGVRLADWSQLRGRTVTIWPDADAPGLKAAREIFEAISQHNRTSVLRVPAEAPAGWDVADAIAEGWTPERLQAFIEAGEETAPTAVAPQPTAPVAPTTRGPFAEAPFRLLGFADGQHYFMAKDLVFGFSLGSLDRRGTLFTLAPEAWWASKFPSNRGVDMAPAINALIQASHALPPFEVSRIRGRGAWADEGRVCVHVGDRLIVDGVAHSLLEHDSRFFYPRRAGLKVSIGEPASASQCLRLIKLLELAQWQDARFAWLAAGWIFLAPICGSLRWRPHVWITGGRGTGKSWLLTNVFSRLLQGFSLECQGDTTEAGLRQNLQSDALPVLFDEIESKDVRSAERIQTILGLMRIASSETGAAVLKGGASGIGMSFLVRSMFCCASIAVAAWEAADVSRITILTLEARNDRDAFDRIKVETNALLTPEFRSGLHARAFAAIPRVREAVEVFARVGASVCGDQRQADQIGTLFAGAWCLIHDGVPTEGDARAVFDKFPMDNLAQDDNEGDDMQCLNHILSTLVKADGVSPVAGVSERTVGELVATMCRFTELESTRICARAALWRIGIIVNREAGTFWVSGRNPNMARILERTPWSRGWARVLGRIPGAKTNEPRKINGRSDKGTRIPLELCLGDCLHDENVAS